jgi:hypothetical protein
MQSLDRVRGALNILIGLFVASLVVAQSLGIVTFTHQIRWVGQLSLLQMLLFTVSAGVRYNSSRAGRARPKKPGLAVIAEVYAIFFTLLFWLVTIGAGGELTHLTGVSASRKLLFGVAALMPVVFTLVVVYGWPSEAPRGKRGSNEAPNDPPS